MGVVSLDEATGRLVGLGRDCRHALPILGAAQCLSSPQAIISAFASSPWAIASSLCSITAAPASSESLRRFGRTDFPLIEMNYATTRSLQQ
nr:hypothetical protein CFP56_66463 [Quercus suber]